ncbi:MAG: hypothetical protein H6695_00800 [Deferribacteres bacterium]|nr:hypothetical protein [candidate division KSB1 bacterium]MCB9508686.1 hypothetical protein [Deferribacteres bacterium]
MAKIKTKARSKKKKVVERELPFSRQNYIIFAVGVLLILIGYLALAQGPYDSFSSMSIAPVLLVIGYCIVIPIAIMLRGKQTVADEAEVKQGD